MLGTCPSSAHRCTSRDRVDGRQTGGHIRSRCLRANRDGCASCHDRSSGGGYDGSGGGGHDGSSGGGHDGSGSGGHDGSGGGAEQGHDDHRHPRHAARD